MDVEIPAAGQRDAGGSLHSLRMSEAFVDTVELSDVAEVVSRLAVSHLGCLRAGLWLRRPRAQVAISGGERLSWVGAGSDWFRTSAFASLPLDGTTPVGLCALSGETLTYASRTAQDRRFPRLARTRQEGGRRTFVPLVSAGRVVGTLALVWPEHGAGAVDDRAVVDRLARCTARAIARVEERREHHTTLMALQQSLLPRLPVTGRVQLQARYLPATRGGAVSGDWYDVLTSVSGALDVVVGDVAGHDASAAAVMGQVRAMLRALTATVDEGPAQLVALLDHAVEASQLEGFSTLLHGRLEHEDRHEGSAWTFSWTRAGHPPPLLLLPGGECRFLHGDTPDTPDTPDLPLGVEATTARRQHQELLPPDSTLLLFTDGLVERRGECVDAGLDRLLATVRHHHDRPLDALLDGVLSDLLGGSHSDDVALLGVRLTPVPEA